MVGCIGNIADFLPRIVKQLAAHIILGPTAIFRNHLCDVSTLPGFELFFPHIQKPSALFYAIAISTFVKCPLGFVELTRRISAIR